MFWIRTQTLDFLNTLNQNILSRTQPPLIRPPWLSKGFRRRRVGELLRIDKVLRKSTCPRNDSKTHSERLFLILGNFCYHLF